MKKLPWLIIAVFLLPLIFANQSGGEGKPKRVLKNCTIRNKSEKTQTPAPCQWLDGMTGSILWPKEELSWEELLAFPKNSKKPIMEFLGFIQDCKEVEIKFNGKPIKKHCIREGKDSEMLFARIFPDNVKEGFTEIAIENISQKPISIIIKRVEPLPGWEDKRTFLSKK